MPLFNTSFLAAIPQLAVVLGIMIIVHEAGHFFAAKLCGVRVETFAIGFGKRLFGIVRNGTDYCVNLLPLGGYVKMAGEMGVTGELDTKPHSTDPGEFQNHPRWQRTFITLAGPIANFLLAYFLLFGLYATHNEVPAFYNQTAVADYITPNSPIARTGMTVGDRIISFDGHQNSTWSDLQLFSLPDLNKSEPFVYEHNGQPVSTTLFVQAKGEPEDFDFAKLGIVPVQQNAPLQVASLSSNDTPAARAGLQPQDRILSVDGQNLHSVQALAAYLETQAGKPAELVVSRAGKTLSLTVHPALMDTQEGKAWKLGFVNVLPPTNIQRMSVPKALRASWEDNRKNSLLIVEVLKRLFTHEVSVKSVSSPIGIGVQVHQAFSMAGWTPIIGMMATISLNLGIFNLLPIPILDGGSILLLAIESILRRDVNQQVKERLAQVAFVCLILFAAVVIFNDITKYLPGHLRT